MKTIKIILIVLLAILYLIPLYAEEGEVEPPLDYVESDTPPSAPTNKSYIIQLFNDYKTAIETKNIDNYLACFSTSFSKEMVEITAEYTNRFYLTYRDIEEGVKTDNFSQYQGKIVKVSYNIKSINFNYTEADIKVELATQITGSTTEKRTEYFKLEWNGEESRWQIISF